MVPLFPACRCDSGANAARPTDRFRAPHPDSRPGQPTADTLPHSFLRAPPDREAFPHGAGLPLGTPRAEQPSSTTKGDGWRATLFAFLRSYYIYARAKGTFRPLGGRGSVRPVEEKRKGGGKRTGGWTFSPLCGKDCGKQIVDKWKIGALFPPPRDERRRSGERCPSSGAPNRESAARSTPKPHTRWRKQALKREKRSPCQRKSPHTGTETRHPTRNTRLLRTEKGAASRKTTERKAKNSCAPRTITTRGASRRTQFFSRTKPFAAANEEK